MNYEQDLRLIYTRSPYIYHRAVRSIYARCPRKHMGADLAKEPSRKGKGYVTLPDARHMPDMRQTHDEADANPAQSR